MLEDLLERIRPIDEGLLKRARERHDHLTKPPGSLGKLETIGVRLAGIYGTLEPEITSCAAVVFAADHGVAKAGVSAYPQEVTAQMVRNFLQGGAAINVLAHTVQAELHVVDVGVATEFTEEHSRFHRQKIGNGTRNFLKEPAMTASELERALEVGADMAQNLCNEGVNLLVGGEMGIGNTTAAAALTTVMTQKPVRHVTGRGTGIEDALFEHKVRVIEQALATHRPDPNVPLEVLRLVGGYEIAALCGFFLGAAANRCATLLDGFISTAAALVAVALKPECRDYMFASHRSKEPGHLVQLEHLRLPYLFDLDFRLGEGTGGVMAVPFMRGAASLLHDMATFDEAGVAGRSRHKKDS